MRGNVRARWVVILCGLLAAVVAAIVIRHVLRLVEESLALEAIRSEDTEERKAALRTLGALRSPRAVRGILDALPEEGKLHAALSTLDEEKAVPSWEDLCVATVRGIGTGAVPVLRSGLASRDSRERFWSLFLLHEIEATLGGDLTPALVALLEDTDGDVRLAAAVPVGLLASNATRLLESLAARLNDAGSSEGFRIAAARAIRVAVDPATRLPDLARLSDVRESKAEDLFPPTPALRSAALALLEAAESPSRMLRHEAVRGLCATRRRWSPGDADLKAGILEVFHRGIRHARPSRRQEALSLPGKLLLEDNESMPPEILEALGTLLLDPDESVRESARMWLMRPEAVPVLLRAVARDDPVGSPAALEALDAIEEPEYIPAMVEHLSRTLAAGDPPVRRAAARVLARHHARGLIDPAALLPWVRDEDEEVLTVIAAALSASGKLDAEVFEERILDRLDPEKPRAVRLAACRVAGDLGPAAAKAAPYLAALVHGDDAETTAAAILALARVAADEALKLSILALGHGSRVVRDAAMTALWDAGSAATPALPALRKLAEEEEDLDLATRASTLANRLAGGGLRPSRGRVPARVPGR